MKKILSWKPHINKIHASISRSIGILHRIRLLVPCWLNRQLYYTLVHSHLHYGQSVCRSATKTNIDRLFLLGKKKEKQHTVYRKPLAYWGTHQSYFFKHSLLTISHLFFHALSIYINNKIISHQSRFFYVLLPNNTQYNLR